MLNSIQHSEAALHFWIADRVRNDDPRLVIPQGSLSYSCLTHCVKCSACYCVTMIRSFACKDTHALFEGRCPRRFMALRKQAERKLQMLDAATDVIDLRSPPGNRLEKLGGARDGQWNIRLNQQWRLCFNFEGGHAIKLQSWIITRR